MNPWTPVLVATGTGDSAAVAAYRTLRLMGLCVSETASTAAVAEVILHHGTSTSDPHLLPPLNLAADGFGVFDFGGGIHCPNGIFVNRVTGETELVLYIYIA